MTVVSSGSFDGLMRRAPALTEQGAGLAQIPIFNATVAAKMTGDAMRNKAELKAIEIQGENLLKAQKLQREPTMAERLTALSTLLPRGGSPSGGDRFAGEALLGLLGQGSTTPNQLQGVFNQTQAQLNESMALMEPWWRGSQGAAVGAIRMN